MINSAIIKLFKAVVFFAAWGGLLQFVGLLDPVIGLWRYTLQNPIEMSFMLVIEYIVMMKIWAGIKDTRLEPIFTVLFYPIFWVQDWIVDKFIAIYFQEMPVGFDGWTEIVTKRMIRYKFTYEGVADNRYIKLSSKEIQKLRLAQSLCWFLNLFDPRGRHC